MNESSTTVLHPALSGLEPPRAVCDTCGRPTWLDDGDVCGFPQADGSTYCQGVLR